MYTLILMYPNGKKFIFACEENRAGVKIWKPNENTWEILKKPNDTPVFKNYLHFGKYLGYSPGFKIISKSSNW